MWMSAGLIALTSAACTMPAERWNDTPDWQLYQRPAGDGPAAAAPASDLAPSVLFAPDTAALAPAARRQLASWAERLLRDPAPLTVAGHGDEHSTRDYAIALGAERAEAVKNYLVALGVPPQRIVTTTYGAERPAMPGASPEAQALDRRAVLRFDSLATVPQP